MYSLKIELVHSTIESYWKQRIVKLIGCHYARPLRDKGFPMYMVRPKLK